MHGQSVVRVQLGDEFSSQEFFESEVIGDCLEVPFCQVGKLFVCANMRLGGSVTVHCVKICRFYLRLFCRFECIRLLLF